MKNKLPLLILLIYLSGIFIKSESNFYVKTNSRNCILIPINLQMFENSIDFNSFDITSQNGKKVEFKILIKDINTKEYRKIITRLYDRYKTADIKYIRIKKNLEEIIFKDRYNLPKKLIQINFRREKLQIERVDFSISTGNGNFHRENISFMDTRNYRLFLFLENVRGFFFKTEIKFKGTPPLPSYCKIYYPMTYFYIKNPPAGLLKIKVEKKFLRKNPLLKAEKLLKCDILSSERKITIRKTFEFLIFLSILVFLLISLITLSKIFKNP